MECKKTKNTGSTLFPYTTVNKTLNSHLNKKILFTVRSINKVGGYNIFILGTW